MNVYMSLWLICLFAPLNNVIIRTTCIITSSSSSTNRAIQFCPGLSKIVASVVIVIEHGSTWFHIWFYILHTFSRLIFFLLVLSFDFFFLQRSSAILSSGSVFWEKSQTLPRKIIFTGSVFKKETCRRNQILTFALRQKRWGCTRLKVNWKRADLQKFSYEQLRTNLRIRSSSTITTCGRGCDHFDGGGILRLLQVFVGLGRERLLYVLPQVVRPLSEVRGRQQILAGVVNGGSKGRRSGREQDEDLKSLETIKHRELFIWN